MGQLCVTCAGWIVSRLTICLNLASIHRKQETRAPIQESIVDTITDSPDNLTCQTTHLFRQSVIDCDGLDGDADTLNRFVAERPLEHGELEGMNDLGNEVG